MGLYQFEKHWIDSGIRNLSTYKGLYLGSRTWLVSIRQRDQTVAVRQSPHLNQNYNKKKPHHFYLEFDNIIPAENLTEIPVLHLLEEPVDFKLESTHDDVWPVICILHQRSATAAAVDVIVSTRFRNLFPPKASYDKNVFQLLAYLGLHVNVMNRLGTP